MKLGAVVPIWNQEIWIRPHFSMLSKLDKVVVLLQDKPLPNYHKEHGYSNVPDKSEELLKKYFPKVEIHKVVTPDKEFGAWIYNEGLQYVQDCDLVFRLDPDMFFTDKVWYKLLSHIQEDPSKCWHMNFAKDSINYYMTGDFEHGLKDAKEWDVLAWNPKEPLQEVLQCPYKYHRVIKFSGFLCHHFRGWCKPKSTPNPEWKNSQYARENFQIYGNNGEWYECPEEIKKKIIL